jgi:hypothetical protein
MKGHTIYEEGGRYTFEKIKGTRAEALNAKQIAKRTCLLIMETFEDSIAGVLFHHRHSHSVDNLVEQACYWLLKCMKPPEQEL